MTSVNVTSNPYSVTVDSTGTSVTIAAVAASATSGTVTSVTPQGDNGSGTTITGSGNIKVAGTAPISTSVSGDTITVSHDTPPGTGTATSFPASIVVDSTGHVSSVGAATVPVIPGNNLSDIASAGTSLTNLGGTTVGKAVFVAANAAAARSAIGAGSGTGDLVASNNLSDLANAGTARSNLGLGTVATTAATAYATAAQGTKADSALQDVVSDTSPQLGGNLDVQARTLTTSTSNGNVVVDPPGTGFLQVEGTTNPGKIRLMCEAGTHGVGLISPAHSTGANYDLVLPIATGSANQALKTDGSGNLGWSTLGTAAATAASAYATAAHTHTDSYAMFITAPADKASPGYVVDARVASARTITNFYVKTESGSCVATLRNITDNVEIASATANTSGASDASLINTGVTANERLGVVISSNSSGVDLQIVVEYTA